MQLDELLDEVRSNILRDASALLEGPADNLWTDESLVRYLNDAQRRFARRTMCLRDGTTPECCEVTLETGVTDYALHPSVLAVMSLRNEDSEQDTPRSKHSLISGAQRPDTEPYGSWSVNAAAITGMPQTWDTDEQLDPDGNSRLQVVHLRVYPKPSAAENGKRVFIRVVRLPLVPLVVSQLSAHPEVPEDYHLDLLEWVAYRALRNWDVDGEDRAKSKDHKARFEEAITEATQEAKRKLFAPHIWQFGGGGFDYER